MLKKLHTFRKKVDSQKHLTTYCRMSHLVTCMKYNGEKIIASFYKFVEFRNIVHANYCIRTINYVNNRDVFLCFSDCKPSN